MKKDVVGMNRPASEEEISLSKVIENFQQQRRDYGHQFLVITNRIKEQEERVAGLERITAKQQLDIQRLKHALAQFVATHPAKRDPIPRGDLD